MEKWKIAVFCLLVILGIWGTRYLKTQKQDKAILHANLKYWRNLSYRIDDCRDAIDWGVKNVKSFVLPYDSDSMSYVDILDTDINEIRFFCREIGKSETLHYSGDYTVLYEMDKPTQPVKIVEAIDAIEWITIGSASVCGHIPRFEGEGLETIKNLCVSDLESLKPELDQLEELVNGYIENSLNEKK